MFTRTAMLAFAAATLFTSLGLAPTSASAAGWWDRYHDRRDIRRDDAEIRHDLATGHYFAAYNEWRDVQKDRRDLFWDRLGY
jgi:hypothetical protein